MKQSFIQSMKHAIEGILYVIKRERNMKIHLFMMFMVIIAGILFHISLYEWIICILLFGLILSLETINTAIEAGIDLISEDYHILAKIAKDTAAGAVLISSIASAIIGLIIFIPKIISYIHMFLN